MPRSFLIRKILGLDDDDEDGNDFKIGDGNQTMKSRPFEQSRQTKSVYRHEG